MEEAYVFQSNYKFQSLALWVPMATIEFAILDLLGRIANQSIGQLIGEIHHPTIAFYQANSERDITGEEVLKHLQQEVSASKTRALKFKVGGRMSHPEFPAGRSEQLIPMIRKIFGDDLQIVQPDVYYFGGMIRSKRVARMAEAMGKVCTPHISGRLGYLYMMHFVSTLPNAGPFHEFKGNSKELPLECKTSNLLIADGVIRVPTGPGCGVTVDPDYLKKYKVVTS